jgi:hypothetical protein
VTNLFVFLSPDHLTNIPNKSSFDKRYDAIASEEVSRVQNLFAGKEVWEVKIEIEKARDKAKVRLCREICQSVADTARRVADQ